MLGRLTGKGGASATGAADGMPTAAKAADSTQASLLGKASGRGKQPGFAAAPREHRKGLAAGALVLLALIWGYTWPVMKVMLDYADPFLYAGMRTFVGGILLVTLLPLFGRSLRPRAVGMTALLGVLQTAGFLGLMTWALEGEGAGKTAILTYTMPFWLLLMAWVFLGERLRGFQWVAVGVALAGLLLVLSPWEMKGGASPFLAIGGALTWAASAIVAKLLRRRHQVDLLSLTAWQLLLGSLPLVVVAVATWSPPMWSGTFIVGFAFTVLAGNCLAWILWLYILNALPAGTAGLGMLLTPVIGIIASWIQLGEQPGGFEGAGMLLIAGALLLTVATEAASGRKRRLLPGK